LSLHPPSVVVILVGSPQASGLRSSLASPFKAKDKSAKDKGEKKESVAAKNRARAMTTGQKRGGAKKEDLEGLAAAIDRAMGGHSERFCGVASHGILRPCVSSLLLLVFVRSMRTTTVPSSAR